MINEVKLIGRLGADPEIRYTTSGSSISTLSLATTRSWKDKTSGEKVEETEWHRVTLFGKIAEIAGEYAKKGDLCYVSGRIKTDKFEKNGETKYSTGIIGDQFRILTNSNSYQSNKNDFSEKKVKEKQNVKSSLEDEFFDDDIPF